MQYAQLLEKLNIDITGLNRTDFRTNGSKPPIVQRRTLNEEDLKFWITLRERQSELQRIYAKSIIISFCTDCVDCRGLFSTLKHVFIADDSIIFFSLTRTFPRDGIIRGGFDEFQRVLTQSSISKIIVLNVPDFDILNFFLPFQAQGKKYVLDRFSINSAKSCLITTESLPTINITLSKPAKDFFRLAYHLKQHDSSKLLLTLIYFISKRKSIQSECHCKGKSLKCCLREAILRLISLLQQHFIQVATRSFTYQMLGKCLSDDMDLFKLLSTIKIQSYIDLGRSPCFNLSE